MCIYKIAKRIVEKREKQIEIIAEKREKERQEGYNRYQFQQKLISSMAEKYISEIVQSYTSKNKPKFSEGQTVLIHPYYKADGWEPDGYSLFHHTPYEGPVKVVIDSIGIDTSCAYENIMDHARDRDTFNKIHSNDQYDEFKRLANGVWSNFYGYEKVMYYYSFHIPDSDHQYWNYSIREDKFLLPTSKAGKAAIKISSLKKKKKELKEKLSRVQEEANELYNLI